MFSAEHYRQMLMALLPQGLIWPKDPDSNLGKLLHARAEGLARVDVRSGELVQESDPRRAFELLESWEKDFGLPDECSALTETLQARRAAVHAIDTMKGGQTPAFFISLAAALGYEVTLTEHSPALTGVACAGEPCNGEAWAHAFTIGAPETTVFNAVAGGAQAGDRVRTWGNEKLECAIEGTKPSHTACLFSYGA